MRRTLMPSAASLSKLCCCVSFNVKLLRPLKMMGSTLHLLSDFLVRAFQWENHARYATTIESFRSMASSATAFVRSTVRSTEFICRRTGCIGASRSTAIGQAIFRMA